MPTPKSQIVSVLVHALGLVLLLVLHARVHIDAPVRAQFKVMPLVYRPPLQDLRLAGRSGGANAGIAPARKGTPPPRLPRAWVPPVLLSHPKLPLPVGLPIEAPPLLTASVIGDPLGKLGGEGLGSGGENSIGRGCCGGIGDSEGPGGLIGAGYGHPLTPPKLIHKVEPEFSEEARKAKYQGTVVLTIQVDESGHPSHFVVVSGPGMGLEARAIEAVSQWRFRPASRDGKPVATTARIEVNFRLM